MPDARPKKGAGRQEKYQKGESEHGPIPARHIPWPEVFKHHQSVLEEHLRMVELIQKHTVDGTPNHEQISKLVARTRHMIQATQETFNTFIPAKGRFGNDPVASSLDGISVAETRRKGVTWKTPVDYEFGQSKSGKSEVYSSEAQQRAGPNSKRVNAGNSETLKVTESTMDRDTGRDSDQHFMVDTNPTPVNGRNSLPDRAKNKRSSSREEDVSGHERSSKKAKPNESVEDHQAGLEPAEEYDNIDAEVEARIQAKADRKKNKEKKRKRESDDSMIDVSALDEEAETAATAIEKPVKKKAKMKKRDQGGDEAASDRKRKGESGMDGLGTGETTEQIAKGAKTEKRKKTKMES